MRAAIVISLVALWGLFGWSEGTSCTSKTLNTCVKSVFMTGTCSSSKCACKSGYTDGPLGCQQQQKAVITADFNGEIKTGADAVISCSEGIGDHEWKKDGTVDTSVTSKTFQFTTADATKTGSYTCKSKIGGLLSQESDAFDVSVLDTMTKKPVVEGMPTAAVANMKVTLTCSQTSKAKPNAYDWKLDGTSESDDSETREYTIAEANKEKPVTCVANGKESDAKTIPASLSATITGAKINSKTNLKLMEAEAMELSCELTGGFPVAPKDTTYAWKKDGNPVTGSDQTLKVPSVTQTDNSGSYTCEATYGGEKKTSAAVAVVVSKNMKKKAVKKSAEEFSTTGHYTLTCEYLTVATSTAVTFAWTKGGTVLAGVTDSVLVFNAATSDYDGNYACSVTSQDGTVTNDAVTITFKSVNDISGDKPTAALKDGTVGVGNTLTFECQDIGFYTPGVTFKWYVENAVQTGKTLQTFDYKPTSADAKEIQCEYTFDGKTSQKSDAYNLSPKYLLGVAIKIDGAVISAGLKPVADSTIKFECDVTKSGGAGSVTYQWKKGSTVESETSKTYELKAGAAGSGAVTIECQATANSESLKETVTVTPGADAEKPTLTASPSPVLEGNTVLTCWSASYAEGAKFAWKKGSDALSGTSYQYKISGLKTSDDGAYTCTITVGGKTSAASDAFTISSAANEETCNYASDCDKENFDSSVCENGKCKCKSGYTLKGGECSGAAAVLGSFLTIVLALIAQKFF